MMNKYKSLKLKYKRSQEEHTCLIVIAVTVCMYYIYHFFKQTQTHTQATFYAILFIVFSHGAGTENWRVNTSLEHTGDFTELQHRPVNFPSVCKL